MSIWKVLKATLRNYNNVLVYHTPYLTCLKHKYCVTAKHRDNKMFCELLPCFPKPPWLLFPKAHFKEFQHERQGAGSSSRTLLIGWLCNCPALIGWSVAKKFAARPSSGPQQWKHARAQHPREFVFFVWIIIARRGECLYWKRTVV